MQEALLDLIGSPGSERPFSEWVADARQAGLQPSAIQSLKRQNVVHTYLTPQGVNMIVRAPRPVPA